MQKRFRVFAALLACSLLLTACDKIESPAPSENAFADYQTGDSAADSAQSIAISALVCYTIGATQLNNIIAGYKSAFLYLFFPLQFCCS